MNAEEIMLVKLFFITVANLGVAAVGVGLLIGLAGVLARDCKETAK